MTVFVAIQRSAPVVLVSSTTAFGQNMAGLVVALEACRDAPIPVAVPPPAHTQVVRDDRAQNCRNTGRWCPMTVYNTAY